MRDFQVSAQVQFSSGNFHLLGVGLCTTCTFWIPNQSNYHRINDTFDYPCTRICSIIIIIIVSTSFLLCSCVYTNNTLSTTTNCTTKTTTNSRLCNTAFSCSTHIYSTSGRSPTPTNTALTPTTGSRTNSKPSASYQPFCTFLVKNKRI